MPAPKKDQEMVTIAIADEQGNVLASSKFDRGWWDKFDLMMKLEDGDPAKELREFIPGFVQCNLDKDYWPKEPSRA